MIVLLPFRMKNKYFDDFFRFSFGEICSIDNIYFILLVTLFKEIINNNLELIFIIIFKIYYFFFEYILNLNS
jgi:hypothetical protein